MKLRFNTKTSRRKKVNIQSVFAVKFQIFFTFTIFCCEIWSVKIWSHGNRLVSREPNFWAAYCYNFFTCLRILDLVIFELTYLIFSINPILVNNCVQLANNVSKCVYSLVCSWWLDPVFFFFFFQMLRPFDYKKQV